jgi:hypothetical protein
MLLQMPLLPAGKSSSTIESEAHSVTKFGVIVQVETVRATPAGANRNGVRNLRSSQMLPYKEHENLFHLLFDDCPMPHLPAFRSPVLQLTKKFPRGGTFSLGVLTEPSAAGWCLNIFLAKLGILSYLHFPLRGSHAWCLPAGRRFKTGQSLIGWFQLVISFQQLTIFVFERRVPSRMLVSQYTYYAPFSLQNSKL